MAKKSVSIVMTYCNRPQQLKLTLMSIAFYAQEVDLQVVIVDDCSSTGQTVWDVLSSRQFEPLKCTVVSLRDKWWINPSYPFNRGFEKATGDIICIQNAESVHFGNILAYAQRCTNDKNYLSFPCYSSLEVQHELLGQLTLDKKFSLTGLLEVLYPLYNKIILPSHPNNRWFNHPTLFPTKYHYFSSITRKNLEELGGFDERYADGFAYEDDDWLFRVEEKPLNVIIPDGEGMVIHQWHPRESKCSEGGLEWVKNRELYRSVVKGKRVVHG